MNVELYHLYISFKINFLIVPSTKQYIMKSIERNTSVKKDREKEEEAKLKNDDKY